MITLKFTCGNTPGTVRQQAQGPKTPRPIRIEQCFPTGVVRTWYALGTECVRSVYGVTGTELVRSWYGVGMEQLGVFFLGPPTPPKIHFKMILSSFPLRKKL